MSSIPCRERAQHRYVCWTVLGRDLCRNSYYDVGWSTPGHHTLLCTECNVAWRSSAKYVDTLPDFDNSLTQRIAEFVDKYPLLAELTYSTEVDALAGSGSSSVHFLHDVATRFSKQGTLSHKQISAVERTIIDHIDWSAQYSIFLEYHAARASALGCSLAPEGKRSVEGVVESVWWFRKPSDTSADSVPRMLVLSDEGFTVESSVPISIRRKFSSISMLLGCRIRLCATFYRHPADWTVALASCPTFRSCVL